MSEKNASAHPVPIFDEWNGFDGLPREAMAAVAAWLDGLEPGVLWQKSEEARLIFQRLGITLWCMGATAGPNSLSRLMSFPVFWQRMNGRFWKKGRSSALKRSHVPS